MRERVKTHRNIQLYPRESREDLHKKKRKEKQTTNKQTKNSL